MEEVDKVGSRETENLRDSMRMSKKEYNKFLCNHGVGVLSLACGSGSYAIPVSYGYEADEELLCVMLGYSPDSKKKRWVEDTETATFVVHEICDDMQAESVIVRGTLSEVEEDELPACYEAFSENASPMILHDSGSFIEEAEFAFYSFYIDTIEGRKFEHDIGPWYGDDP